MAERGAVDYLKSALAIRARCENVLAGGVGSPAESIAAWEAKNAVLLERAQRMLAELGDAKVPDLSMLSVALRELRNLA